MNDGSTYRGSFIGQKIGQIWHIALKVGKNLIGMPNQLRLSIRQPDHPAPSQEAIEWAIRLFVGREPHFGEVAAHQGHANLDSLRRAFAETAEFRAFLLSFSPWTVPVFLLEPPANSSIPMLLRPPTLAEPTSQLCTEAQFREDLHTEFCTALDIDPTHMHRKIWEFAWIMAVLRKADLLRPDKRGIGFGVGNEPFPAFLAKLGIEVMATDAPSAIIAGQGWDTTGQHASSREQLWRPNIVDRESFEKYVSFTFADMNHIPDSFCGFDFCWSACSFEHLGSIEQGLDFVRNSLKTLKPGGLAIHTTEFNLTSNQDTFEHPSLSLFRKQDIERLYERLIQEGHQPWPLNLFPGNGKIDAFVDLPPFSLPHLKLNVSKYVTTSIGLVVQKSSG
ncbi:MAG: class I SAM-dependent methyltransferase [Roseomonas sp.]|nr:class I SAM-dependent methyltransferase [Roseomonas sp.]